MFVASVELACGMLGLKADLAAIEGGSGSASGADFETTGAAEGVAVPLVRLTVTPIITPTISIRTINGSVRNRDEALLWTWLMELPSGGRYKLD